MALIRREVTALLWRGREALWALAVIVAGLWLIWLGGYVLAPLGAAIGLLGAGMALLASRRLRFHQAVDAPGIVEVDEAQVGYLGPASGGFVSLAELVELRLITVRGRKLWRLKQADGQALLIPVEAEGADALFDAFASLPGMGTAALVAALDPAQPETGAATTGLPSLQTDAMRVIWRRKGMGVVAR
jgi:hypothetical protein